MSITKDFENYLLETKLKVDSSSNYKWIDELKKRVLNPDNNDTDWFIKLCELQQKHDFDSDIFGTYMEESKLTNPNLGQFYTPMHIAKLMSMFTTPHDFKEHLDSKYIGVNDPCSGTGRFMIAHSSSAVENMKQFWTPTSFKYVNTDLDNNNYIFSTLNAVLRNLFSINIWGNTLTFEVYGAIMTLPNTSGIASWESRINLEEIKKMLIGSLEKTTKSEKESKNKKQNNNNINLKLF